MKKLAVALIAVVVVALAVLLVLPSFWDWNAEKGRIAALVKEHTGRELNIAGDVSLSLLPAPTFAAEQVTLANLEGGSEPAMVTLEEMRVSIALLPLLRGEVLVERVTLVRPEILLEVLEDGRVNWRLADALPAAAPGEPVTPGSSADPGGTVASAATRPIRIDSFIVEDGLVRYRDARSGREETLSGLDAELAAESLVGPFAAEGSAIYQGVPLDFAINLGQLVDGGATATSVSLQLPGAGASSSFVGALSRHQDLQTLRGRLQVEGNDLAQVLGALRLASPAADAAGFLAQPFELSAELSASSSEASAEAVALSLGPLSLDGKVVADLTAGPDIALNLSAKTIDLDALLASAAEVSSAAPAAPGQPPAPAGGDAPAPDGADGADGAIGGLPSGISASLVLTAAAVVYRDQPLRQLKVAARLEDGRLTITEAAVQLPGSSDVQLSGTVTTESGGPRFIGTVAAESDNLRGLLRWLGSNPEAVPAERLRRLVLKTDLEVAPGQVVLRNSDLRLDVSRLTGGAAIALRERPGIGLALNIDRVNLDAYLPPPGAMGAPAAAPPAQSQAGGGEADSQAATPAPLAVPLLGRFDANIDLRVGELIYQGLPIGGLRLDATLRQGGLVVRELSVADLVGSRGWFSGSVANVDRNPSIDGSLEVTVSALSRLATTLGFDSAGPLPLEAFTLSGAVNGNHEALRFDQRLAALGGTLRASGRALLQPGKPLIEASVALGHPDLSVLLRELLRDPAVPAGLGAVAVEGRLTGGGSDFSLSGLTGRLAGIELLGGDLAVALAGPRPKITADIRAGELPLAALAAPADRGRAAGDSGGDAARDSAPAAGRERWSHKPLDLASLRAVDMDLTLAAEALLAGRLRLTGVRLEAHLDDGLLELTRFTAGGYGGTVAVTGRADARDAAAGLVLAAEVAASTVELNGLLRDLVDSDRFSGPVTLAASLATRGTSEAALVSGLAGDGTLSGTVTVATKVEEQAGALLLGILGQKVEEVRGIADTTTMLFGAFAGAPAAVDGSFVVSEGVARTDDLTVRGRDAVARTTGSVDLPEWRLDSTTEVYRNAEPQDPYLTARLRGPLDEPNVTIGGQAFRRRPQPAPDEAPAAEQRPERQPVEPEQLLKEGFRNLLQGLGG